MLPVFKIFWVGCSIILGVQQISMVIYAVYVHQTCFTRVASSSAKKHNMIGLACPNTTNGDTVNIFCQSPIVDYWIGSCLVNCCEKKIVNQFQVAWAPVDRIDPIDNISVDPCSNLYFLSTLGQLGKRRCIMVLFAVFLWRESGVVQ